MNRTLVGGILALGLSLVAAGALLTALGCDGKQGDVSPQALQSAARVAEQIQGVLVAEDLDLVQKAAQIATAMQVEPAEASDILAANGLTLAQFDQMLTKIAESDHLQTAFDDLCAALMSAAKL